MSNFRYLAILLILFFVLHSFAFEKLVFKRFKGENTVLPESLQVPEDKTDLTATLEMKIDLTIPVEDGKIYDVNESFKSLILSDFTLTGNQDNPALPAKTYKYLLKGKNDIIAVRLEKVSFLKADNKVNIAPYPKDKAWNGSDDSDFYKADPSGFKLNRYLPGKVFSRELSFEGQNTILYLTVNPVQYNPVTKELLLIKNYSFRIFYRQIPEKVLKFKGENSLDSIILTTEALAASASAFKKFHEERELNCAIFTVEGIDKEFSPVSEKPLPDGIKNEYFTKINIKLWSEQTQEGYNYTLARKIISFLNKLVEKKNLKYITILGNAQLVPPSYYFRHEETAKDATGDEIQKTELIPTDYFYASPDVEKGLDYFAETAVGRIPVKSNQEALIVLKKFRAWEQEKSKGDWTSAITTASGIGNPNKIFIGENSTNYSIERENVNWLKTKKLYFTENLFTKALVLKNLTKENEAGFFYHIDHGTGNELLINQERLSSDELIKLPENGKVPVFLSVACLNGLWDDVLLLRKPYNSEFSIGESVLLSKGAGIAYLGNSRNAYGLPLFYFDEYGNVKINRVVYSLELLDEFLKKYLNQEKPSPLGDFVRGALNVFSKEKGNDMKNQSNLRALYTFTFLGDPTLIFPLRKKGNTLKTYPSSRTQIPTNAAMQFPQIERRNLKNPIVISNPERKNLLVKLYRVLNYYKPAIKGKEPEDEIQESFELAGGVTMSAEKLEEKLLLSENQSEVKYKVPENLFNGSYTEDPKKITTYLIKLFYKDGDSFKNEARIRFMIK